MVQDNIAQAPRGLAFIDVAPGCKLIPMALEFMDGKVETLFDQLKGHDGRTPPPYPKRDECDDFEVDRNNYWKWFSDNYQAKQDIDLVEESTSKNGKILWADSRLPLAKPVKPYICT